MPREYKNLVSDTTATVGLDDFVLSGVVGFPGTQTFAAHTDGVEVGYHVFSADRLEFEVGKGIWNAGVLTRVAIEESSSNDTKVVFSAGVKVVMSTIVASDMIAPFYAQPIVGAGVIDPDGVNPVPDFIFDNNGSMMMELVQL